MEIGNIFDNLFEAKPVLDESMFSRCTSFEGYVAIYQHIGGLTRANAICASLERVCSMLKVAS
jgi:hypothetical protein